MRTLSATIKAVLAQDFGETKDVVIITVPEQQGATVYPETTLYFANGEGVVLDGKVYENKLRGIGAIKFSLGKAPDNTEIAIENVSRDLGFTLTDFRRALDGSKVEIKRAFKTSDSTWETDSMFTGYVKEHPKVSQDIIGLVLSSDMTRRGTSVAGRPLTQRCIYRFNTNGSGVGPLCGWITSQPGNPLSCDKGLETVNGCQAHGNQHRFGGVPAFTALDVNAAAQTGTGYDSTGGGWGESSGGGWCISIDSLVLAEKEEKRVWMEAKKLQHADILISIDPEGRFVPTRVVRVEDSIIKELTTLTTEKGYSLSSSPEHGIMKKYSHADGVAVQDFSIGEEVLAYDFKNHVHLKDVIKSIVISSQETRVLKIQLEAPNHLFMAANNELGAIVSHNQKPGFTSNYGFGVDHLMLQVA